MGAETSKISIETCLISVFKSDKLGFDGGAFCANGADLTMTNATFFGRTDSDNVAVLSADTIAMTGCTLRVEAEKSVHALLGSVSIADCSLYASGHSGNSAKTVSQTAGLDAFETVSQQSGVTELIVVSAAKAEEKPAEEKPTEKSPVEETKTGFTDVLDADWFKADVEKAVENKLMTGTSTTTFNPKGVTTRAMVVATLYRLAGSPEVTEKAAFTDVASGSYYEAAVAWAAKNEIASGTSATTFEPNKAVTREQLAKFLFNYAVYQGMDAVTLSENLISFEDHASVSGYAVPAMQWAVGQGLINGTDGKLLPTGTATRCQFAAILNRFTAAQSEKA